MASQLIKYYVSTLPIGSIHFLDGPSDNVGNCIQYFVWKTSNIYVCVCDRMLCNMHAFHVIIFPYILPSLNVKHTQHPYTHSLTVTMINVYIAFIHKTHKHKHSNMCVRSFTKCSNYFIQTILFCHHRRCRCHLCDNVKTTCDIGLYTVHEWKPMYFCYLFCLFFHFQFHFVVVCTFIMWWHSWYAIFQICCLTWTEEKCLYCCMFQAHTLSHSQQPPPFASRCISTKLLPSYSFAASGFSVCFYLSY